MGQQRGNYLVMLAPPVPAAAAATAAACPPATTGASLRRRHLLSLGSGAANVIQAKQQEPAGRCCLALVRGSHRPTPASGGESAGVRRSSSQGQPAPPAALFPAPFSACFCLLRLPLLPGARSGPKLLLRCLLLLLSSPRFAL
ncbi:left-right determination factor 2-like [Platysternon megacephalum]|uniref:Left-right determination factor 2-like n=1 Tax=Platysternon megacephalum TaxID=55544 RepID=A0A4D9EGM9_9SAUR|nr:left-right determination factor 2-like [Platysternon megacephalum]